MDPNATLARILAHLLILRDEPPTHQPGDIDVARHAGEALDQLEDLRGWLRKGGALPDEWKPR